MINAAQEYLLASVSALAVTAAAIPFAIKDLANKETFYTFVKQNTARAIMKGDSLSHIIMSYEDHYLNDPYAQWYIPEIPKWEVLPSARWADIIRQHGHEGKIYPSQNWFEKRIGVFPIGLPGYRSVYNYQFVWSEMRNAKDKDGSPKREIWSRDEKTGFVYVTNFPYATKLSAGENIESMPLDVELEVIVRIVNPEKALFRPNWFQGVMSTVIGEARNYVGGRTYKELLSETRIKPTDNANPLDNPNVLACAIIKTNDLFDTDIESTPPGERGLIGRFGVEVISVSIESVAFVGEGAAKYQASATAAYTSEQDALIKKTAAEAQAFEIKTVGTAKNEVIKGKGDADASNLTARGKALSEMSETLALKLLETDAMTAQGDKTTFVWGTNPFNGK